MADLLIQYDNPVAPDEGPAYQVRAIGRRLSDNLWEGWLEFVPDDDSQVLRTRRETTQPNREDLEYWATGLEKVYLEGALERARRHQTLAPATAPSSSATPFFDEPAPRPSERAKERKAALDPYRIHQSQGDSVLRRQLKALNDWQLQSVAIAHDILDGETAERLGSDELIEAIISAVRS